MPRGNLRLRKRRPRNGRAAVGMGALFLVAGRAARADVNDGLELRWTAPASCATEAEVRAKVERYLGGPAATRGAFVARGVVGRERGERWRLTLAIAHRG